METEITFVGDLPLEQQELDDAGVAARKRLNELVLAEYEQTGTLASDRVCEAAAAFESFAAGHIKSEK